MIAMEGGYGGSMMVGGSMMKHVNSYKFYKYCKEHKIVTLCMPSYLLYLLQLLDVGCFGLLKRAYYTELNS
jgi:hypothetical protein